MLKDETKRITSKRILLFLAITFALTYALEFAFVLPSGMQEEASGVLYRIVSGIAIMTPAISVLITRLLTKEGFVEHYLHPHINKGTVRYYLLAWLLPAGLIAIGILLYFLVFPAQFDWNMTYYMDTVLKTGTKVELDALRKTMISQTITGVILGPVTYCITCFGEEWGWRGYLLPKMMKCMPVIPAVLISGLIWGLWRIPYVLGGLNYGLEYEGYPYLGILLMTLFCIMIGCFHSFVTIRTGSCIPAIIAHGAINATYAAGIYFTKDGGDPLLGPSVAGILSMIPVIITAVIIICILARNSACVNNSLCDTIIEESSNGDENVE